MTKISNQYSLTNILTADLANSRLGINNVSPAYSLDLTGTARVTGNLTTNIASGLLKSVSNILTQAVAGTDYQAPITLTTTGTSGAGFARTLNYKILRS